MNRKWSKITNDVLMKLIDSMPRIIEAVSENNVWKQDIGFINT